MNLILDAFAVFRLTRLITQDEITRPLREWPNRHRDWANPGPEPRLAYLLGCRWCMSIWVAALVVAARRRAPRAWDPIATALGLSAVTSLIASTVEG